MASGKIKSLMHDLSSNDCMYFTFVLHLDQSGKKKFFSLKIEQSGFSVYFLLFPHPNFFFFFGISLSNLEKIGIDEKVVLP